MQRQLYTAIILLLLCLGMNSCIKDTDIIPNTDEPPTGMENTTFVFSVNNSAPTNGAVVDRDLGTASEYTVHSATVYLFDKHTEKLTKTISLRDIKEIGIKDLTVFYGSKKEEVKAGEYILLVIANAQNTFSGSSLEELLEEIDKTTYSKGIFYYIPSQGLIMTNRASDNRNVVIGSSQDQTVTIVLERVAAKVEVGQKQDYFELKDASGKAYATLKLHEFKMINLLKRFYLFRHVLQMDKFPSQQPAFKFPADYEKMNKTNGYVVDPYFFDKVTPYKANKDFFAQELIDVMAHEGWTAMEPSQKSTVQFCLENTLYKSSQISGYTTGVVFRTTVKPEEILTLHSVLEPSVTPYTIYYTDKKFYQTIEVLKKRLKISLPIDEQTSTEDLRKLNIVRLSLNNGNYYCYYNYWIKHIDNNVPDKMEAMEYGIVRNNHYKIFVNSIKDIGAGNPIIEVDNTNEKEANFNADTNIYPWVVFK